MKRIYVWGNNMWMTLTKIVFCMQLDRPQNAFIMYECTEI